MYRLSKNSAKRGGSKGRRRTVDPLPEATPDLNELATEGSNLLADAVVARTGASDAKNGQTHVDAFISSNFTADTPHEASQLHQIVQHKMRFTAPPMFYDTVSKSICVNPRFERVTVMQLSRIQGVVLHQLRQSQQQAAARAPKELLYDLELTLLYVVLSATPLLPTTVAPFSQCGDDGPLQCIADSGKVAEAMPNIERVFAHRVAPMKSIAALGYVLSEGISHAAIDDFMRLLSERVEAESDPSMDARRTSEERLALHGTKNNVRDLAQLWGAVQVAYRGIYTDSQRQRALDLPTPLFDPVLNRASASADLQSANLLVDNYYKLLRWILAVDHDRLALLNSSRANNVPVPFFAKPTVGTPTTAVAAGKEITVTEYDPYAGRITIERHSSSSRWGLIFNGFGHLIGIENDLRNGSEAGEQLYHALQQSKGSAGFAVFQINRNRIRATDLSAVELETEKGEIMMRLTNCLRAEGNTLRLVVERKRHAELTTAREVLFEVGQQGAERAMGQQVVLILERAAPTIPWGLILTAPPNTSPLLTDFSDKLQLSEKAKNFLFDNRGRLQVVSVNYQDTRRHFTTEKLKQYMSESLLLALWLQVTEPPSEMIKGLPPFEGVLSIKGAADDTDFPTAEEVATTPEEASELATKRADEGDKILLGSTEDLDGKGAESFGAVADSDGSLPQTAEETSGMSGIGVGDADQELLKVSAFRLKADTSGEEPMEYAERDVELEVYETQTGDPLPAAEAHGADQVTEGDLPEESDTPELEGAGAGGGGREGVRSIPKSQPVESASASSSDRKSKQNSKVKLSKKGLKISKKGKGREDDAISGDESGWKEVDGTTEVPRAEDFTPLGDGHTTAGTPLIEPGQSLAEIAVSVTDEAANLGTNLTHAKRGRPPKNSTKGAHTKTLKRKHSKNATTHRQSGAAGQEWETTTAVKDEPLIDSLKTSAEVAMEVAAAAGPSLADKVVESNELSLSRSDGEDARDLTTAAASSDTTAAVQRAISIAQLLDSAPLKFVNQVVADRFDGTTLELSRPSTEVPWNIKMAFVGDEVLLSKLPSVKGETQSHPYLKYLGVKSDGNVRCTVESMNGLDLILASRTEKAKLMDAVKRSTKLSMILKVLR